MKRYFVAGVGIALVTLMLAQVGMAQNRNNDEWRQRVTIGQERDQVGGAAGAGQAGTQVTVTGTIVSLREYMLHGQEAATQTQQRQGQSPQRPQLGQQEGQRAMVLLLDPGQSLTGGATGAGQQPQQQQRDESIRPIESMGGETGAKPQSNQRTGGQTGANARSNERTGGQTGANARSNERTGGQTGANARSNERTGGQTGANAGSTSERYQPSGQQNEFGGGATGARQGQAVLLVSSQDSPQALSQAGDMLGQRVRVTGKAYTRNGMQAIAVERIERIEQQQQRN